MRSSTLGASAQVIAGYGNSHPWDPSDLLRCVNFCRSENIDTDELRLRMAGRSAEWDRLLVEWDDLVALLNHEMQTRTDHMAPRTYQAMRRVIAGGTDCDACEATGRGPDCPKCMGTGRRSGGRCRAAGCRYGAINCTACRGRGYFTDSGSIDGGYAIALAILLAVALVYVAVGLQAAR